MKLHEIFETTSAGGIATVSMPLGKVRKRMKDASVYEHDVANTYKYTSPKNYDDYSAKRAELIEIINSGEEEAVKIAQDYLIRLDQDAKRLGLL